MTDKDLKRLRREELLEMLIAQSKKTEELQAELDEVKAKLKSRDLLIREAGSIAEAAIRVNGVFEAAQAAAEQYLDNLKRLSGPLPQDADPGSKTGGPAEEAAEEPAAESEDSADTEPGAGQQPKDGQGSKKE